jgi:hypothetical protein
MHYVRAESVFSVAMFGNTNEIVFMPETVTAIVSPKINSEFDLR